MVFPLSTSCRGNVEGILPVFLHSGWEVIHAGEKRSHLPHILFGEDTAPGGHSGVTDAGTNRKEDVPLGMIRRIGNQVGSRRIEVLGQRGGLAVEAAMAERSVLVVDIHSVD